MRRISLLAGLLWFLLSSGVAHAVPIGYISFDAFIPGPDGVNSFSINNLTGDPLSGGFSLPPDFPVFDSLTWVDSTLLLTVGVIDGSPEVISYNIGSIGPGSFDPTGILEFPDTTNFLSATFTATLNQTSFLLSDGSLFEAASPFVTVALLPGSGSFLTAGFDFAVIDVAPVDVAPVPEPGTWLLMGSGVAGLWAWGRKRMVKS